MGGAYCYFRRQPLSEDKDSGYHELTERNGTSVGAKHQPIKVGIHEMDVIATVPAAPLISDVTTNC
jgi:hypothetical protein